MTQLGTVLLNVNGKSVAVLTPKGDEFELSHQLDCCGAEGSLAASEIVDTVLMKNLLFVLLDRGTVCIHLRLGPVVACETLNISCTEVSCIFRLFGENNLCMCDVYKQ